MQIDRRIEYTEKIQDISQWVKTNSENNSYFRAPTHHHFFNVSAALKLCYLRIDLSPLWHIPIYRPVERYGDSGVMSTPLLRLTEALTLFPIRGTNYARPKIAYRIGSPPLDLTKFRRTYTLWVWAGKNSYAWVLAWPI